MEGRQIFSLPPMATLKIFAITGFQQFDYDVPLCSMVCVYLAWGFSNLFGSVGLQFHQI